MPLLVRKICILYAIIYLLSLCAATVNASPTAASKVSLPTVGQSRYLGCWQDTDVDEDKHRVTVASDDTVSVPRCIQMCWNLRHLYALLKNGLECICTPSMNSLQPSYTTNCTMQCAGNGVYPCGSQDHVSAFHTGYIPEPEYTNMLDSIPAGKFLESLMGCYSDYDKRFCRAAISFETPRLSVAMCISVCAELLAVYAGLQVGTTSSSTVDGTDLVEPEACFRTCGDGQSFMCGGADTYLAIYLTGITVKRSIISRFKKPVWMNSHIPKTLVNEIQAYPKNKKAVRDTEPPAKSLAEEIAETREKLNKNAMLAFWVLVSLVAAAVIFTVVCCVCRYALPRFRSSGYQTVAAV